MMPGNGNSLQDNEKFVQMAQDPQWRLVNRTMRMNGYQPDALIETLHSVQNAFGYVDNDAMEYVAYNLCIPLSRVFAVSTFYHYFTLKPPGEHTCVVCMGTACYIGGAAAILDEIYQKIAVRPGETTGDGKVSLLLARCLGSCGHAPAVVFDGEVAGKMNSAAVLKRIGRWFGHDTDA